MNLFSPSLTNPSAPDSTRPTVVILEDDLFFSPRLVDVVQAQGGTAVVTEGPDAFVAAMDRYFPVLAIIDLKTAGDWAEAIQRCKMRPHTRQIPLYAFGSHVDVQTLQAARKAGADHAWARSRMMEQLVELVERHVNPPVRYLEGWDDDLSPQAQAGVAEFNRGEFFEQHERFEEAWMAEPRAVRDLYQGILQVGVAFLQIEQGNWPGAIKLFRRGLPKLRDLPPVVQGLDMAAFYAEAAAIHWEITELGPERLDEFDHSRFPRIIRLNQ